MLIYRLEIKSNGEGPFRWSNSLAADTILGWYTAKTHPTPRYDGISVLGLEAYKFGCESLAILKKWMINDEEKYRAVAEVYGDTDIDPAVMADEIAKSNDDVRGYLEEDGYCVAIYDIPNIFCRVGTSKLQVAFLPNKATSRVTHPLSMLYDSDS